MAEVEAICRKWYGNRWDDPDSRNRPSENVKVIWRRFAKQAIETIDEMRQGDYADFKVRVLK